MKIAKSNNENNVSERVSVNGFPKDLWDVWNKDCLKNFQDIRYLKMWTDHIKAQSYDLLVKSQYLVIQENQAQQEEEVEQKEESGGLGLLNPETGGE